MTFDVFKDLEEIKTDDQPPAEEEAAEEGAETKQVVVEQKEQLPRFVLVPEVVKEPRMFFYRVPRLGSYLAIRLEFQSCMFEEAFDAGLADYLAMQEREKERQEKYKVWEADEKERKEEAEGNGEEFKPTEFNMEEIAAKPFLTQKISFVVCLNTMGMDRAFSNDERLAALRIVQ